MSNHPLLREHPLSSERGLGDYEASLFVAADCLKQMIAAHSDEVKAMVSCLNKINELSTSRRVGVAVRNSLVLL